ncbi:uncharacterized protein LOC110021806 [Phalaenopsis equestris]|uniref:uncharacterized protein LOC110021806 n=1 Tax=Phalaenopsis equestris TaxID=78828 RepID=UPI0009E4C9F0|nr:uncharacterized protein LOC110021806 [Phalaenopsis equestris]
MLPRTSSIFHFEEEEGQGEGEGKIENEVINGGTLSRKTAGKGLVGLQILISKHELEANNNVVIKSSMKFCRKPEDFLKFCHLCSKELSLQQEVYMYRGDQGFCSVECRNRQILEDERIEFNASTRSRFRVPNGHHMGSKIQDSGGRTKITASA